MDTSMTKDEALKLALDALEVASSCVDGYYIPKGKTHLPEVEEAITALRQAIAEAEKQKPVAWMVWGENNVPALTRTKPADRYVFDALYTSPPKREPLTDEQIKQIELNLRQYNIRDTYDLSLNEFARAIEQAHGIGEKK
jgi:hypothetical protein